MMRSIPWKESLETEFKSDLRYYNDHDLIEEIVSMTNTEGGVLYLGVEDDGAITGIHPDHDDSIGVAALIANSTVPPVSVRAEVVAEEGQQVLRIEIPKSRTVVSTASGKILRRRLKQDGSPQKTPMFSYEIPSRLSALGLLDFSAQPLPGATVDDLDPAMRVLLRQIIQSRPGGDKSLLTLPDDELDAALRLVTRVGDCPVPTVTGMLLIGKEARIAELAPTAKSSFQVLEGTTVRLNEESSKPLLRLFDTYETYITAWNPERELLDGFYRLPIPEFDRAAFREGLVNAFSHRDYTMLGAVRVLIDDEGLTITSPGGFIDGVNLQNLLTVEPCGRNPALADALKRIGLAEKTGRGIDRIFEGSILYGRPWPDYSESTSRSVRLFIPRARPDIAFTKFLTEEQNRQGKALSIYALMILSLLNTERRCSLRQLEEETHLPPGKLQSALESLIESGLITASGKGDRRIFTTGRRFGQDSGKMAEAIAHTDISAGYESEKVMALAARQQGIITKQDIADDLKVTPSQAYAIIRQLCQQGRLALLQSGKYSKYRMV